jgi:hypothetical protein
LLPVWLLQLPIQSHSLMPLDGTAMLIVLEAA